MIKVQKENFSIEAEIKKINNSFENIGAISSFIGTVRNKSVNENLISMTLEHYPGMTELEIESIVNESCERWSVSAVTVIHRIGKLLPSDQIVFVGVASKHRQESFDACNFVMDWLKTQAPFWKIEDDGNKKKWIEFNSRDNDAVKKWIV